MANALINPLTALFDIPNGALLDSPDTLKLMRELFEEASAVAFANGQKMGETDWQEIVTICRNTSRNHSSMLQDVKRQKRTEVESINGYLVARGKEAGITTPLHEVLLRLILLKTDMGMEKEEATLDDHVGECLGLFLGDADGCAFSWISTRLSRSLRMEAGQEAGGPLGGEYHEFFVDSFCRCRVWHHLATSFVGLVVGGLLFLITIALLGWVQVKFKGKLSLKKVGFSAWRLSFLWFGIVYIVLFTTGIVKTMGVV